MSKGKIVKVCAKGGKERGYFTENKKDSPTKQTGQYQLRLLVPARRVAKQMVGYHKDKPWVGDNKYREPS